MSARRSRESRRSRCLFSDMTPRGSGVELLAAELQKPGERVGEGLPARFVDPVHVDGQVRGGLLAYGLLDEPAEARVAQARRPVGEHDAELQRIRVLVAGG